MHIPGSTPDLPQSESLGVRSNSMHPRIGEPPPQELETGKKNAPGSGLRSTEGHIPRSGRPIFMHSNLKQWPFIECLLCARHTPGAVYPLPEITFSTTLPGHFLSRWGNRVRGFTGIHIEVLLFELNPCKLSIVYLLFSLPLLKPWHT